MNDGRNILSDDKAKALREIIEQEEAGRATERNCTNCRKWAKCMEGPLTPGEMRHATCWVPENKAKTPREIIEQELETGRVYVISARGNCKTAAMKAALERAAEQAQQIKQHLTETRLERLAKEIDRQLERLLTEYPDTPVEDFVSSFIPGGVRITAPDGAAFDFRVHDAWTEHGRQNDDHDNGADRHGDQGRGGEQE